MLTPARVAGAAEGATLRQCIVFDRDADNVRAAAQQRCGESGEHSFLLWLIRELSRYGVRDFVLVTSRPRPDCLAKLDVLRRQLPLAVEIRSVVAHQAATPAAVLHGVHAVLADRFLVCDATQIWTGNIARLLAAAADESLADLLLAVTDPQIATSPREWPTLCILRRKLVADPSFRPSFKYISMNGRRVSDSHSAESTKLLKDSLRRPALFLDRDGVINVDHGWVGSEERFEWMPGALEAIRLATDAGWHVFVVTNQSGIARGFYTEGDFHRLHAWMCAKIHAHGGTIDDFRYCPFHPAAAVERYRAVSDWRKPGPGMILDLIRAWELDPARCTLVGDQQTDMLAATRAGIVGRLFRGGNVADFIRPLI